MSRWDAAALALAVLLMVSMLPFVPAADADAAEAADGVLFYEVSPFGDTEGFALKNYGGSAVDLSGYEVRKAPDASASQTFEVTSSLVLDPGDVAVFSGSPDDGYWFCESGEGRDVYTMSAVGSRTLSINNDAGTLYLCTPSGALADAVAYRSSLNGADKANPQAGWSGQSAYLGHKEDSIRRVEAADTDTAADWTPAGDGLLSESYGSVPTASCTVTPFSFPESSGKPVYDALAGADDYVHISIYMLTSRNIISILCDLESKNVQVTLILEEGPFGYGHPVEDLAALREAGADIWMIGAGTDDRYDYVHNKYMVVDGDTVVITSENWTSGNMECSGDPGKGNRGWGAVIEGAEFAQRMESIFQNDLGYSADLSSFSDEYPDAVPSEDLPSYADAASYGESIDYDSRTFAADVSIYMSPDNTYKALTSLIDGAEERVYSQQMDVGSGWESLSVESPVTAMADAAYRGVDARLLLLAASDAKGFIDELNSQSNIKAAYQSSSGFATMHNKGVVVDDAVWVSSVNWTSNSFYNNRECGLVIRSAEVADWYADLFLEDWDANYDLKNNLTLVPEGGVPADGEQMTVTAKGAVGPCQWTISRDSGDSTASTEGAALTIENYEDLNYIRVVDSQGNEGRFVLTYAPAPGTVPEGPDTAPDDPDTAPDDPGTVPDDPDTTPDDPGTVPDDPGAASDPDSAEADPSSHLDDLPKEALPVIAAVILAILGLIVKVIRR